MRYLIWLSNGCTSLREVVDSIRSENVDIEIMLLQDGVYLADKGCTQSNELEELGLKVYALKQHVDERGLANRLVVDVSLLDYSSVIDLIMERCEKIICL